ncbi:MAG: SAM-dependent methyltransferase [Gammaproteobacteria bacterium]|nr:SAM-dependent methyltransferase [Gammaproteobacteria bacterium]
MDSELPELLAAEQERSDALQTRLKENITAQSFLPFSDVMQSLLYEPELGYYVAGAEKFGAQGDFVTAPELSPLFARALARQCQPVLQELGAAEILELGAGSGKMAADLLLELERLDCLPLRYAILELSAELQQRQRETLLQKAPHLLDRVVWLQRWSNGFVGLVLANEVLDAMPVERFKIVDAEIKQLGLVLEAGALKEAYRPAPIGLKEAVEGLQQELEAPLAEGFCSEVNLQLEGWFAALSESLQKGALLLIDYGYARREFYQPERSAGTLSCFYRHRVHDDPYQRFGVQDVTASVEFTAVVEAASKAGFELEGYVTQANFLFNNDLDQLVATAAEGLDKVALLKLSQAVKTLTLPSEMGERFKVMGLSKGLTQHLQGFSHNDISRRL